MGPIMLTGPVTHVQRKNWKGRKLWKCTANGNSLPKKGSGSRKMEFKIINSWSETQ